MSERATPEWTDPHGSVGSSGPLEERPLRARDVLGRLAEEPADGLNKATVSRPKRIACIICRKRKLRCDGDKPTCGTCSKLGHKCAYDEVRRKSGPKRGYVKQLEARLAQVETQLKTKDDTPPRPMGSMNQPLPSAGFQVSGAGMPGRLGEQNLATAFAATASNLAPAPQMLSVTMTGSDDTSAPSSDFPWEMIGLGLEEPLPPAEIMEELHQNYFDTIHPSVPMIHKYRYLAALNLAPYMRPAICLRYAMWALACSVTEKFMSYAGIFYQRARKYAEADEMKGHGESFVTVGHAQCWVLVACYEFKMMYFPRAWMSSGRASRLCLMLGLHRIDGRGLEVKQTLPTPRDATDKEERRRTFWMSFCNDRYASIGTGWPMTFEENDILTNLPATTEAYEKGHSQDTASLPEALTADGAANLSATAGVSLIACLFGRNLTHLHRNEDDDRPEDPVNGDFWKRHRKLDSILTNTLLFLPEHLRTPTGAKDPNVLFLNVTIHAAIICLHQAAILKAEKNMVGANIMRAGTNRCFAAAEEIINIMKLVSHVDSAHMNPFLSFCLYVAARVFTHALKRTPDDETIRTNLEFLLITMQAHRRKNNLTESFLVQLIIELEAAGLPNPLNKTRHPLLPPRRANELRYPDDTCVTVFQSPSETQPSYHELRRTTAPRPSAAPLPRPGYNKCVIDSYTAPSFTVPQRDGRAPTTAAGASSTTLADQSVLMSHGWAPNTAVQASTPAMPQYRAFGAETSSEAPTERSEIPLPQSTMNSRHPSSHTSYSPAPDDHDEATDRVNAPYFQDPGQFQAFATSAPSFPSRNATTHDFTMTGGWDMNAGPLAAPLADQQWAPVLEPMEWADGASSWRPHLAGAHAQR